VIEVTLAAVLYLSVLALGELLLGVSGGQIQGSLHCAADDGAVRCFGRDDVAFGYADGVIWMSEMT
jgi:hypothetical protein